MQFHIVKYKKQMLLAVYVARSGIWQLPFTV